MPPKLVKNMQFLTFNLENFTPDWIFLHRHVCGVCDKYEVCSLPLKANLLKQLALDSDWEFVAVTARVLLLWSSSLDGNWAAESMFVGIALLVVSSDHRGYMNMYTALQSSPHNITWIFIYVHIDCRVKICLYAGCRVKIYALIRCELQHHVDSCKPTHAD